MNPHHPTPLKFLMPGWFAVVMGLCGLSLAWLRATTLMGNMAGAVGLAVGMVAVVVMLALLALSVLRHLRYPQALAEDLKHPVRHAFIATLPISLILVATVLHAGDAPQALCAALWMLGASLQFAVTVWVLSRWLNVLGAKASASFWAGITPVLFIPVVGNVITPLAGVPLGYAEWSAAQFGIGLFFWPVVLTLLAARIGIQGMWPERLLPSTFITVAPPALVGLSALQLGAPPAVAWLCWGMALFFLVWSATVVKRMLNQPFAITFWALSFPLAAFAALTLRLSPAGGAFSVLAMLSLAMCSIVVAGLSIATYKGLRQGYLLAPEPVASIMPVGSVPAP